MISVLGEEVLLQLSLVEIKDVQTHSTSQGIWARREKQRDEGARRDRWGNANLVFIGYDGEVGCRQL